MAIELGDISFDESVLFKQLRNDFRDDWFPDPLSYSDMLDSGIVSKGVTNNFVNNHGEYIPISRSVLNIPKLDLTLRYALETGLPDRALYHGLVAYLVPYFDKLIRWNVFSHRRDQIRPTKRYLLRRAIPAWKDFVGSVGSAITENNFLLSTDLTNYYENIDFERLRRQMVGMIPAIDATPNEKRVIRTYTDLLFKCLVEWGFTKERGLPQNRDASSFLANLYLHPVDEAMTKKGYAYFRYMDDIKVVCATAFEARRALKDLVLALRDIGLSVNSKKTKICAGSNKADISENLDGGSPQIQQFDEVWNTRSREAIARSFTPLKLLTLELLHAGKVGSREFRFCIKRLEFLALCKDFSVPAEFYSEITPEIIQAIPLNPASTDQFVKYLLAIDTPQQELAHISEYLRDEAKSIYTWQNYRLWALLAQKRYNNDETLAHACQIIKTGSDTATRAGATLYAGSAGSSPPRIEVAKNFRTLTSFLGQRSALIACHELPYRPIVEDHVKPYLRADLVGVYSQLRNTSRGIYHVPPERVSLTGLINIEREYE